MFLKKQKKYIKPDAPFLLNLSQTQKNYQPLIGCFEKKYKNCIINKVLVWSRTVENYRIKIISSFSEIHLIFLSLVVFNFPVITILSIFLTIHLIPPYFTISDFCTFWLNKKWSYFKRVKIVQSVRYNKQRSMSNFHVFLVPSFKTIIINLVFPLIFWVLDYRKTSSQNLESTRTG